MLSEAITVEIETQILDFMREERYQISDRCLKFGNALRVELGSGLS